LSDQDIKKVYIVGLGLNPLDLPSESLQRISGAQVLVGGQRLLEYFKDHPSDKIAIRGPLDHVIERIKKEIAEKKDIVVLADGDPGFYGIGRRILDALGRDMVHIYPNLTTLQVAASRLKIPWQDIQTVSLHGRQDMQPLFNALVRNDWVAVYTDLVFHPARIADELCRRGVDTFEMYVFEELCTESEKIGHFALKEAADRTFSSPNFVILDRVRQAQLPLCLGLGDERYLHQRGMITKREVRATGLALLGIEPHHIVWDLGAGSGSMAIEASILANRGRVLAVERDPERAEMICKNIQETGAYGVEVIHGEMPGCLDALPDPDRVFIGGGMGRDNRVLEEACRRLRPGGKIVLHLVLMGSLARARDYLTALNWPFSITQVQVSRSRPTAGDQRLVAINPVYILKTRKLKVKYDY
jgi:precorrin-6Y C5,15-methyltransferase (decarboxylating)